MPTNRSKNKPKNQPKRRKIHTFQFFYRDRRSKDYEPVGEARGHDVFEALERINQDQNAYFEPFIDDIVFEVVMDGKKRRGHFEFTPTGR